MSIHLSWIRIKKISLIVAIQGLASLGYGQSDNLLEQAAAAYADADYKTAISLYEQVLAGGQDAFELYFNLGNAYFKTGDIAATMLNYERAARINPSDPDLQHNLAIAQSQTVDKIEMLPVPEFVSGYKSFVNAYSADQLGLASIITFILMLGAIAVFLLLGQRWVKQTALAGAIIFGIATGLLVLFAAQQQSWLNSNKEAIIFSPSITVNSTPDDTGEELFVLHEGTKVRVIERFRDWIRIRIGDGNVGWIPKDTAVEI